jgi:hypothetical protein
MKTAVIDLTVCHPALCLSWFRSIDDDSDNCAKEVFKYHLQEYQSTALEPASLQPASDWPAESNSFLVSIAHHSLSLLLTTAAPKLASEFERYALFEHRIQEHDVLENPLLWWKVNNFNVPS